MLIERKVLLQALQTVAPALSANKLIPVLSHIWFDGDSAIAYNDQLAIAVPLPTDFKAAVPGEILISLISASRAKKGVELTLGEDMALQVRAGNARMRLATMPPEAFLFEMPPTQAGIETSPGLLSAIEHCLRSASNDATIPEQLGVTVVPDGDVLHVFGTNNATLSYATAPNQENITERVILPSGFCRQLVHIAKAKGVYISLAEDHALAWGQNITIFGRLISTQHPLDLLATVIGRIPEDFYPVPQRLALSVERACVVASGMSRGHHTAIRLTNGRMHLSTVTDAGHVEDAIATPHIPEAAINLKINPELVKIGLTMPLMQMSDDCMVFTNKEGSAYYLVAAMA